MAKGVAIGERGESVDPAVMTEARKASAPRRLKLCRVVTIAWTWQTQLMEQLRCISRHEIDLTLVSSPGPELDAAALQVCARGVGIAMKRKPSPLADLWSLFRLTCFFRRNRFDIVHSLNPKAGLLTAVAGRLAGVPVRLHTYTEQPWVELSGLRRRIPRECDRLTAMAATRCYADSRSQRDFLIQEGLVAAVKIGVIGHGSLSGVELARFSPEAFSGGGARATRREQGIPDEALVVIFVGRVTKDKGILELSAAFEILGKRNENLHLVLVGPFEPERDPLPPDTEARLKSNRRIHLVGFTTVPEKYLAAADIFCLPSYREGFGGVVIEASAMGLPAVVTRITGLVDTVVEGETGIIVPPKDVDGLVEALQLLVDSPAKRRALGEAGRRRAIEKFDARNVTEAVVAEYFRLIAMDCK